MLSLGIPKEIKPLEKRVGLIPECAAEITGMGAKVYVQEGAGESSGYTDTEYQNAGAQIVKTAAEIYDMADFIQKVKEPLAPEFGYLRPGQILFSYLHLASPENCPLVKVLAEKKVTAIAFETLAVQGRLPLLAPMSEIAGSLSAAYASFFLNEPGKTEVTGELESIARDYPVWKKLNSPGKVVIWGGGVAGQSAMITALKLGGEVTVIEKDLSRHTILKKTGAVVYSPEQNFNRELENADVFIGSVHVRGTRAFQVLSPEKLKAVSAKKKKIIMDISIDQGGNFPEAQATSYTHPLYRDSSGNLRFSVANIPSLCGKGASKALSREVLPWTEKIILSPSAWRDSEEIFSAVNLNDGKILMQAIAEAHGL